MLLINVKLNGKQMFLINMTGQKFSFVMRKTENESMIKTAFF